MDRLEGALEPHPASSESNRHASFPSNYRKDSMKEDGISNMLNERSPPAEASTPTSRLPLVFALEVSSTSERVFQQEKKAISYLTSKLEPDVPIEQSHVLPWDRQAHDPIPAHLVKTLRHGFGSDPSTIFENPLSRNRLEQAKFWFLMTDGIIEDNLANAFVKKITEAGLHGTPAVTIVFGSRSRPPSRSKFSIGMSVCATSPHCAVIFHDVWSGELFIVQAKGCFASLLPRGSYFKWFGGTRWADMPRTSYERLLRVCVPDPLQLSTDHVALPYGKVFDMKSIYNDSMSDQDKCQLLSNKSALDAIMVVAKTRGESFLVKLWIESLRRSASSKDIALTERDDVNSRGKAAMACLLLATEREQQVQNSPQKDYWHCLTSVTSPRWSRCFQMHLLSNLDHRRESVRLLNKQNWHNFEAKMEMERKACSHVTKCLLEVQSAMGILDDSSLERQSDASLPGTFWYPSSGIKASRGTESPSTRARELNSEDLDTPLFLPGFKGRRKLPKDERSGAYGTCPICREPNSIQTLLLKTSPKENETPNLPLPNQRLNVKYPLALGECPELDVFMPITCCDGCAFLTLKVDKPLNGHHIAAALPLVSLHDKDNRRLWRHKLDEIYRQRFHGSNVLLIFLATICTRIEGNPDMATCLEWCRDELSKLPGIHIPTSARPKLVTSLPSAADNRVPPQQVAFFACLGNKFYRKVVLAQPMEGFVVLVHLTASMSVVKPQSIRNLVWERLLCHIIEQHSRLRKNFGAEYANTMLRDIIQSPSSPDQGRDVVDIPKRRRTSISLTSLVNTYLIPPGSIIVSHLFRVVCFGDIYSTTEFNAAMAIFLKMLATIPYYNEDVTDILEEIKGVANKLRHVGEDMRNVFEDPESLDEPGAAYVITHLGSWLKYVVLRN